MHKQKASGTRDRFMKLSLKKNRIKNDEEEQKKNRSSDCIIIDESFDRLCSDFPRKIQRSPKMYSPIVIDDSGMSDDLPIVIVDSKEPSRTENPRLPDHRFSPISGPSSGEHDSRRNADSNRKTTVSLNCSQQNASPTTDQPSNNGWSPAQNILCATPRQKAIPTTPSDEANESLKECSLEKIQMSQKKLLDDLYGKQWKSIPTLFKTIKRKYNAMEGISKKLHFNDEDSDKENIRKDLTALKMLYLTDSTTKARKENDITERKSKKKLYTEKIPSTPDIPRAKPVKTRNVNTTSKKKKAMSVTELVATMNDVDTLTKKVENVHMESVLPIVDVMKTPESVVKRLSFVGSLADNIPNWRCHPEALQYKDDYKKLREQLCRRLFVEFNRGVFDDQLDADMIITWDSKLRSTAGTTTNRLVKRSNGDKIRTSSIKLSSKVVDGCQRLRDTLVHELCHAATWLLDGELRAGHGPLWKKWATKALRVYPELGEISRCHDMEIHFKYSYKCTKCGYSVQRHSKSIDITKKCCGYCRGTFQVIVNKKTKDGVVVSTPARKGGPNDFALYVKENYSSIKDPAKTHAQVMKILGEQFSAKKAKACVDT